MSSAAESALSFTVCVALKVPDTGGGTYYELYATDYERVDPEQGKHVINKY
jgi:hypothetical protein